MKNQVPVQSSSFEPFAENAIEQNANYFKSLIQSQFPGIQGIDDLVQDTLVRIWSKQHLYDPIKSSFLTWASRVCICLCLDHLRKLKTRPTILCSEPIQSDLMYTSSQDTIGLLALVNSLNMEEREVIDLAYFRGFTHQEIASHINIPLGTVKTRIIRGLKKLRHYFPEAIN
jgi:RNA polymerase sigma-70 factor (ECF subfamily)